MTTEAATVRDRIKSLRRVRAGDLISHPKNWRRHPAGQAAAMRGALTEIGYADALLVRETKKGLQIIDGHLRAELNPDQKVPCLVLDVTAKEADKLLATFDPITAMAETDIEKLSALAGTLDFDVPELGDLVAATLGDTGSSVTEDDPPEVQDGPCVAQVGDVWKCGRHRVVCGDATDAAVVALVMRGELADCVFTSPPYAVGVDYGEYEDTIENLRRLLEAFSVVWKSVLCQGGFAVVNFGDVLSGKTLAGSDVVCEYPMALEHWPIFRKAGYVLWSRRVWCKPGAAVGSSRHCIGTNRAASNFEHIWTWKLPGTPVVDDQISGDFPSQNGWFDTTHDNHLEVGLRVHGAGMPVAVAHRMILVHSRRGHVVHEPCCGTGTTLIAAEQLGRTCYGIEIEPKYIDVILQRYMNLTNVSPVRESDGALFSELVKLEAVPA